MGCSWCHDGRHIVVLLAAPGQMARDGPTSMARQLCVVKVVTGMPPTMTAAPRACDTFAPCFGNIDMCWRAPLDKLMAPEADAVLLLESQRAAIVCELPSMEVRAQLAVPQGYARLAICDMGWTAGGQVVAAWTAHAPALLVTVHCSSSGATRHVITLGTGAHGRSKLNISDFSISPQMEHLAVAWQWHHGSVIAHVQAVLVDLVSGDQTQLGALYQDLCYGQEVDGRSVPTMADDAFMLARLLSQPGAYHCYLRWAPSGGQVALCEVFDAQSRASCQLFSAPSGSLMYAAATYEQHTVDPVWSPDSKLMLTSHAVLDFENITTYKCRCKGLVIGQGSIPRDFYTFAPGKPLLVHFCNWNADLSSAVADEEADSSGLYHWEFVSASSSCLVHRVSGLNHQACKSVEPIFAWHPTLRSHSIYAWSRACGQMSGLCIWWMPTSTSSS